MKQESYESSDFFSSESESNKWAGGFLILMGGIFFLSMSGVSIMGMSPWLLVALLPVYWIGVTAYKRYQEDGSVSGRVFSILVWGLLPFAYMVGAFSGLNVGALWPIGLIAVGVSMILFGAQK